MAIVQKLLPFEVINLQYRMKTPSKVIDVNEFNKNQCGTVHIRAEHRAPVIHDTASTRNGGTFVVLRQKDNCRYGGFIVFVMAEA